MNQVVTMTIMMIILIGTNLALCALVNRGYHRPIIGQYNSADSVHTCTHHESIARLPS